MRPSVKRYRAARSRSDRAEAVFRAECRAEIDAGEPAAHIAAELGWSRQRFWAWMRADQPRERLADEPEPPEIVERLAPKVWERLDGLRCLTPEGVAYLHRSPVRPESVRWQLGSGMGVGYAEGVTAALRLAEGKGWAILTDPSKGTMKVRAGRKPSSAGDPAA